MQHQLPHLSPPGGCCVAPQPVAAAVGVVPLVAVAALVVVFAMKPAAPSQS
jgi:hypothetical protein